MMLGPPDIITVDRDLETLLIGCSINSTDCLLLPVTNEVQCL